MVGDKQQKNSVELEASLAPAEAEVGAMAKADQKIIHRINGFLRLQLSTEVGAGVETKADQKSESNKWHRGGYSLLCLHTRNTLLGPPSTPVEIVQST